MAKVNGNALNEKGSLKQLVRDGLTERVKGNILNGVKGCELVEGKKNILVFPHTDKLGNDIYTVVEIRTTLKHPSELAERGKKEKTASETIEFIDSEAEVE